MIKTTSDLQGPEAGAEAAKLSKTAKVTVVRHAQHPAEGRGGGL